MLSQRLIAVCALALSFVVAPHAHADAMSDWREAVVKKVLENQTYPRSAVAQEIEGRAIVLLMINPDGSIKDHNVLQATGEIVLDREIPKIVQRSNPLPALPAGEAETTLVVPLTWSLN